MLKKIKNIFIIFFLVSFQNVGFCDDNINNFQKQIKTRGGLSLGQNLEEINKTKNFENIDIFQRGDLSNNEELINNSLDFIKVYKQNTPSPRLKVRGAVGSNIFAKYSYAVVFILTHTDYRGSGAVIDNKNGLILTSWHIVQEAYEKNQNVSIYFKPKSGKDIDINNFWSANIKKIHKDADLALLKLNKIPEEIISIDIGIISDIKVGDDTHVIGHPSDGLFWSYTKGIISQFRKDHEWFYDEKNKHKADIIQTQAPINPGNSGGPLLNDDGSLIGVVTMGMEGGQGLNFAVAVSEVKKLINLPDQDYSKPRKKKEIKKRDKQEIDPDHWCVGKKEENVPWNEFLGKVTRIKIDRDCNKVIDAVALISKVEPKHILILDDDENGKDELEIDFYKKGDDDLYFYDYDEDGKPDMIGIDHNQDGTIDKFEKPLG